MGGDEEERREEKRRKRETDKQEQERKTEGVMLGTFLRFKFSSNRRKLPASAILIFPFWAPIRGSPLS